MRRLLFVLAIWVGSTSPAFAQVNVAVNIGIDVPAYPQLVRVPDYPVYYAPQLNANYFFYDGLYWIFDGENWYASDWYNGPWELVPSEAVPLFILRVPVRYYRHPPSYFRVWSASAPPRWGERWGRTWEQRHRGWEHWNRSATPAPAPLPTYQRQYSGNRYPRVEQQQVLQRQNYRYRPHETVAQRHYESGPTPPPQVQQQAPSAPAQSFGRQEAPRERGPTRQERAANALPPPPQTAAPAPIPLQPQQEGRRQAERQAQQRAQQQAQQQEVQRQQAVQQQAQQRGQQQQAQQRAQQQAQQEQAQRAQQQAAQQQGQQRAQQQAQQQQAEQRQQVAAQREQQPPQGRGQERKEHPGQGGGEPGK